MQSNVAVQLKKRQDEYLLEQAKKALASGDFQKAKELEAATKEVILI